jgi:signal peptidase I
MTEQEVAGQVMDPGLLNGDVVLIDRAAYWTATPQRGDIISYLAPGDVVRRLSRIIALPGESIHITAGVVYIGGRELHEPYLSRPDRATFPQGGGDYLVPARNYFVMQDDREHTSDSRVFCAISRRVIEGPAVLTVWPLSRFGLIGGGPTLDDAASAAVRSGGRCP